MASPVSLSTTTSTHIDPATGLPYQTINSTSSVTSHGRPVAGALAATPSETGTPSTPRHTSTGEVAGAGAASEEPRHAGLVGGGHITPKLASYDAKDISDATKDVKDIKEALTLAVKTARDATIPGRNVSLQDNAIVLGWNRAHTQRFNEAEINKVNNLGGATMKLDGNVAKLVSGQLSDAQRNEFIRQMTDELNVKTRYLHEVRQRVGLAPKTAGRRAACAYA